jgi:DHA1 family inner membrane transport protein
VFQAPLRLVLALRISTAPGVLLATAMSTVVFTATPFLIRGIAIDRGLDVGVVGVVSTAQLLGFSLAAWGAGRFVQPSRRILVGALLLGVAANAASALAPQFWLLTATRLGSGVSLGLISWIAWAEAFGDQEKVGDARSGLPPSHC